MQEVFIVGGHIPKDNEQNGNIFTIPSNKYAEFNMFLDPLAAKTVLESDLKITLIPLNAQRKVTSYPTMLNRLELVYKTPEAKFAHKLLSLLHNLQRINKLYHHMVSLISTFIFLYKKNLSIISMPNQLLFWILLICRTYFWAKFLVQ